MFKHIFKGLACTLTMCGVLLSSIFRMVPCVKSSSSVVQVCLKGPCRFTLLQRSSQVPPNL